MIKKIFLPVILVQLLCLFCTPDIANKNGTGTDAGEAKVVTGKVSKNQVSSEGNEVILHQIYSKSNDNVMSETTYTSKDGQYKFEKISTGYYTVEALSGDTLSCMERFQIEDGDSIIVQNLTMLSSVDFSGTLVYKGNALADAQVHGLGLSCKAVSSSNGNFQIKMPSGTHLLRFTQKSSLLEGSCVVSEKNNGDTIQLNSIPYTVLENFDNFSSRNNIGLLMGDGYWWHHTDVGYGGKSTITPITGSNFNDAITSDGSYKGKCLHIKYMIDSSYSGCLALIGTDISDKSESSKGRSFFDLSKMNAFKFRAKGTGRIFIEFVSGQSKLTFRVPLILTDKWTQYTINSDSIPSEKSTPWSTGAKSVNKITFKAERYAELWLDEIIIEGMLPEDFYKVAK